MISCVDDKIIHNDKKDNSAKFRKQSPTKAKFDQRPENRINFEVYLLYRIADQSNSMSNSDSCDGFLDWSWVQKDPKGKWLAHTESQVSKVDIFNQLLDTEGEKNHDQDFNRKEQGRMRNKVNAKNSRDRKRIQIQLMKKKIKVLENENTTLRSEKYCKYCRKPFGDLMMNCEKTSCVENVHHFQSEKEQRLPPRETLQILQFQKPDFRPKPRNVGKIWIALAVLMFVIGIRMHGFDGDPSYLGLERVDISKGEPDRWYSEFKSGKENSNHPPGESYFNMKMLFHEHKQAPKGQKVRDKQSKFSTRIVFQENQRELLTAEEEEFRIHKDFIYSIEAEIEDIGRYL